MAAPTDPTEAPGGAGLSSPSTARDPIFRGHAPDGINQGVSANQNPAPPTTPPLVPLPTTGGGHPGMGYVPTPASPNGPDPLDRTKAQQAAYAMLNAAEQAKSDAALRQAKATYATGVAKMQQVENAVKLGALGAAGVKQQQALLNQNGFKVAVDGVSGPETQAALQMWAQQTQNQQNSLIRGAALQADPGTIHAATNAAIPQDQSMRERAHVIGQLNIERQQIAQARLHLPNNGSPDDINQTNLLNQTDAAITRALAAANDPIRGYDRAAIHNMFLKSLLNEKAALQNANNGPGNSTADQLVETATSMLGTLGKAAAPLTDYIGSFWSAGFEAALHGNYWQGVQAVASSAVNLPYLNDLPGVKQLLGGASHLIAPGGSEARKAIQQTGTRVQRDALVSQGELLSLGQTLTGDFTPQFQKKYGIAPGGFKVWDPAIGHAHLTSGAIDAYATIASDPTTYVLAAMEPFKQVGDFAGAQMLKEVPESARAYFGDEVIRQFGRARYLQTSATGRALMDAAGSALDDLSRTKTIQGIMAAVKGIDEGTAVKIIEARSAALTVDGARQAGRDILTQAFQRGVWNPEVSVLRQITNAVGAKAGLFDAVPGLVPSIGKAVQLSDRLTFIRNLAAGRGDLASAYESNATDFIVSATDTAAAVAGKTINGVWDTSVKPLVEKLDMADRFYRIVDAVDQIASPALTLARDAIMRPFFNNTALMDTISVSSYMEGVLLGQDGFDQALRKIEVAVALASGDVAHEAATKQFMADLARGFVQKAGNANRLVATAAADIGLTLPKPELGATIDSTRALISKLPDELQTHFNSILESIQGDPKKLAALERDLVEVSSNRSLREEVLSSVKTETDRLHAFQDHMDNRPGLGIRRGPVQKLARLVLANTDVAPDVSMRFTDRTANESMHSYLRGRNAARYLDAFHITGAVKDSLIAAMENAKSEEEFAHAAERMARAAMDSKGIENPDAVIKILQTQGHFGVQKGAADSIPWRSLDENGQPVADLQMLSQRMETMRVPQPTEIAQAFRKAILDGTHDAHMADLIAAQFRSTIDKFGGITFHIATKNGDLITLSNAAHAIFRQWKFLVVSNAAMPLIGAVGGFIAAGGSLTDRLKGAGLGLAYGTSAAFGHYLFKVTGLEDRTRMLLAGGMTPDTAIPGWASTMSRRYDDPFRRTLSDDLVRQGNYDVNHFENDFLVSVDPAWVAVSRADSRAPDAWWRIHNFQIHPESDPVTAILLREKAGMLAHEETVAVETKVAEKVPVEAGLAAEKTEDPFAALYDQIAATPVTPAGPDNAALLQRYPDRGTMTFYRGEQAGSEFAARGGYWIPENYNPGVEDGGLKYAQSIAGESGLVYSVDLPINEKGIAMVGERAPAGEIGWMLDTTKEARMWADAGVPLRPTEDKVPPTVIAPKTKTTTKLTYQKVLVSDRQQADRQIADFLKTEEGAIWMDRWKGAILGAAKPDEAVARMRAFIDRYSTPELAAMRVAGGEEGTAVQIDRDTLKRLLKTGQGPDAFHAQDSWRMPKSAGDLYKKYEKTIGKYVLAGPSNALNRRPWQNALFNGEYDRLVLNGVDREEAQRIADAFATKRVNSILHRFDEPSRFAAKLDNTAFIPFQHAREDLVRAYAKLVTERPFQTLRVGFYAARIFNDAKQTGLFTKNEFTGQWEVTLPMNGRLGESLFGSTFQVGFEAPVQDLLFVTNGPDNMGFVPQPGGPFWSLFSRGLAEAAPQVFEGNNAVHHWLLQYGPSGDLLPKSSNRLWMGLTGTTPPWEIANQAQWKNEHEHVQIEITQELIHAHIVNNPSDTTWMPTQAQVDEATSHYYDTWAFHSAISPIGAFPVLTSQTKYEATRNAYTLGGLLPFNPDDFLKQYPEFTPYIIGSDGKYVGPDDLATINRLNVGAGPGSLTKFNPETGLWDNITPKLQRENYQAESQLGYRQYNWSDWKNKMKGYQRTGDYFRALADAHANPVPALREAALVAVDKKYADIVAGNRLTANIERDVYTVLHTYPQQAQAAALQRIREQYGLSNVDLLNYQKKVTQPNEMLVNYKLSPWTTARSPGDVSAAVDAHMGSNANPFALAQYVATLAPAEQYNYWNSRRNSAGQDPFMSAKDVLAEYKYANDQLFGVEKKYGDILFPPKTKEEGHPFYDPNFKNPFTQLVAVAKNNIGVQTNATFAAIDKITQEMQVAAQAKNWKVYYALKAKQQLLYSHADALHNELLNKLPDLTKYYEDLHAASVYDSIGNKTAAAEARHQAEIDKHPNVFVQISEQKTWAAMPPAVQRQYLKELTDRLDMPHDKTPYAVASYIKAQTGLSTMYWEYLTPTQQALLEKFYPSRVANWKYLSDYYLHNPASYGKGGSAVPADLAQAYAILDAANRRGGMAKPAAYAAYLALPYNPAAKAAFLDQHPDVKAYLAAGPFAHMSAVDKAFVSKTLAKYGKGSGYSSGSSYGTRGPFAGIHWAKKGTGFAGGGQAMDLAWAKEQLTLWSRRPKGALAPSTYNLWLNMPSGPDKAAYMTAHPEIAQWIQLGPMQNMPTDYQNIVRDIMTHYAGWTQTINPLGTTINQFYALPSYARNNFLILHPELEVYWAATKSPAEAAMQDLQNAYFGIQDVGARRNFLASHPELAQHFVDARNQRYNRFLNQVAVYMGANPDTFNEWMTRQNDVMAELLQRFAEPMLIREVGPGYVAAAQDSGTERTRKAERAPRNRNAA